MDYDIQTPRQHGIPFDWNHPDREGRNVSLETTAALLAQIIGDDSNTNNSVVNSTIWNTMLLENIDGLVHVLSSKGVFVYASPSWEQLGYSQSDLFGTSIKDICHPADVLNLIDQIEKAKDRNGVDEVFRIRHRNGHYARVHHYGSAWDYDDEQWVSFVGRQEPMASNVCEVLENTEFLGDEDVWFKITTSGLVLAVFSTSRNTLGISSENVAGTTFQNLIQETQSRKLFEDMLNDTKDGHQVPRSFQLQEAESQSTSVETTIFSGDMSPSGKPCFLLVRCRMPGESSLKSS
jgi:PAS domain S-box-containing protein